MLKLDYFNDVVPVSSGIHRNFRGHIKERSPRHYSVELMASGKMYFQRRPGRRHTFEAPTLRWQAPGHVYDYGSVDEYGWEHYFVVFRGPRAEKLYAEGFHRLATDVFIPVKRVDVFRDLFTRIHHALLHSSVHTANAMVSLEQILVRAAEETADRHSEGRYAGALDRICSLIHLEPGRQVDYRELARSMGLSYSHFRKCFVAHTGITPHRYVLRARLRAAADWLSRTDDPIKRIAHDLKLGNPAQFSKTFRRHFGLPPGAYRHAAGDEPIQPDAGRVR
jgi:AraC-like DNA-binding protein